MRRLFFLIALLLLSGARDPILVPEISQHEIEVRQGFKGTELLLFGAILTPDGTRAGQDYDIVVVLKGPVQAITLREKQRVMGLWLNADSSAFRSAPGFFAVASSRPIEKIVNGQTAAIYELGLPWLQLSPIGEINPKSQSRFAAGLVDLMGRNGLYQQSTSGVTISEQVLYQARIALPSNVQTGTYTAETFAITRGQVVASATSTVEVKKIGFERAIADFADQSGFSYGIFTVCIAVLLGWMAGRLFALV